MVTAINLTAIILSSLSLILSFAALAMVIGQKLSSHKIEWRPLTQATIEEEADESESFDDYSDIKTLNKAYDLQRSSKKQQADSDPLDDILQSHNF